MLNYIYSELDRALLAAYEWPAHLSDGRSANKEILGRLLEENLRRAEGK